MTIRASRDSHVTAITSTGPTLRYIYALEVNENAT
jgi:hypothetical protein